VRLYGVCVPCFCSSDSEYKVSLEQLPKLIATTVITRNTSKSLNKPTKFRSSICGNVVELRDTEGHNTDSYTPQVWRPGSKSRRLHGRMVRAYAKLFLRLLAKKSPAFERPRKADRTRILFVR
jgi:hypothetical protein